MNSGPYDPPPSDDPPASEPQGVQPEPQQPPQAPPPGYYGPPPDYGPPPQYGPPLRQRNLAPIIAGLVIVVVVIAAVGGYLVAGLAFAQTRLNTAHTAYNKVVEHQNSLTDTVNSAQDKFNGSTVSNTTSGSLTSFKTTMADVITKSQQAQSQINADDAALASADAGLKDNQWLTVLSRSQLNKESAKLGHERKALAAAKVLTADYVQIGNFYQAFADVFIDFDTLATKAQAHDLTGVAASSTQLKADAAKAIALDKAPGLPPAIDTLLHDVQNIGTDFTNLINDASQNNTAGVTAAQNALQADASKVESFDFTKAGNDIDAYYKPLIDAYNSEVDKANAG